MVYTTWQLDNLLWSFISNSLYCLLATKMTFNSVSSVPPGSRPVYVNASLLKKLACEQAVYNTQILGLSLKETPVIPLTGTALHKFLSTLLLTNMAGSAVEEMLTIAPADQKIRSTLLALSSSYPHLPEPTFHKDGTSFVEKEIIIPWRQYIIGDQDITIVLWARPDWLSLVNNILKIQDLKTSNYYDTSVAISKYDYEIQFKFYAWLCYEFGHQFLPMEIANLARDLRMVTQVLLAQMGSRPKWTWCQPVAITGADMEMMTSLLEYALENFIIPLNTQLVEPLQNGRLTNTCFQCDYKHLCHTADAGIREGLKERMFNMRPYGPRTAVMEGEQPY